MESTTTVRLDRTHTDAYKSLISLHGVADRAAQDAGLSPLLLELVKIRVSQVNGCAHCLRMHTRDALALGESSDRLAVLPAWRETTYFTDQEREALAVAESVTDITGPRPERHGHLSDEQVSAVSWMSIVMNGFNRVAISSEYEVGP